MLYKLLPTQLPELAEIAGRHDCGAVYPLSVAEGIQGGDIFSDSLTDPKIFLLWANCGFAYLAGDVNIAFLDDVYNLMIDSKKTDNKRFLLMTKSQQVRDYFSQKADTTAEQRFLFSYPGCARFAAPDLPDGYELKRIDDNLMQKIYGQITPSFFWRSAEDFLQNGFGFCITCGDRVVSWAFSAGVSSAEIDIGIETHAEHKHRGLGLIVADMMIRATLAYGKKPVWACHYKNTASERLSEKLGFCKISECSVIRIN